ncbi:MAG: hypothetical protein ABJD11_09415 [Gemmatimonadota bacterium]
MGAERSERRLRPVRRPPSVHSAFSVLSVFFVVSAFSASILSAQGLAAGRIVRILGRDTSAVPGVEVVLHRVGREAQGPVDSARTDARGRFRFRFTPDTASIFLVSAGHQGVQYFSPPVHVNPALPDTALVLVVADTSRTAAVSIQARHIVVSRPAADGTRPVLEIVVLQNNGDHTRVSPDSLTPSWAMRLPRGVLSVQPGQGDFSPDAISTRGDSLLLFAPISPGDKQVVVSYTIPSNLSTVGYAIDQPAGTVAFLLEEEGTSLSGGLAAAEPQTVEGRTFRRWTGSPKAGDLITINFPSAGSTRWLLPALVGLVSVVLVGALIALLRRRTPALAQAYRAPMPPVPAARLAPDDSALVDRIAALDARFGGDESAVTAEEWTAYQQERAELKAQLAQSLARDERGA